MRVVGVIAFACSCAHVQPTAPKTIVEAPRPPAIHSLYHSGARLKIEWARPMGGDPDAAIPHRIFDSKLGVVCEPNEGVCLPVGETPDDQKVGFLEKEQRTPVLLVEPSECEKDHATTDSRLFSMLIVTLRGAEDYNRRWRLDAPRVVSAAWFGEGPGCVVHYEKWPGPLCVRPFRDAGLHDLVSLKERLLGGGVVVSEGSDGAMVPPPGGPQYDDRKNDLRCGIADGDACMPAEYGIFALDSTVTVGGEATVILGRPAKWALARNPDRYFEIADPGEGKGTTVDKHKVLRELRDEDVVHFTSSVEGEGRVGLHVRAIDGITVPVALFDRKTKRKCVPAETDDGMRCVTLLPTACMATVVRTTNTNVLTGSTSFCHYPSTCCPGGLVWFPAVPAHEPRRYGYNGGASRPAIPARAIRFATEPRETDHVGGWQDDVRALVWDQVEVSSADAFPALELVRDP
jgi:hypothetical protein